MSTKIKDNTYIGNLIKLSMGGLFDKKKKIEIIVFLASYCLCCKLNKLFLFYALIHFKNRKNKIFSKIIECFRLQLNTFIFKYFPSLLDVILD